MGEGNPRASLEFKHESKNPLDIQAGDLEAAYRLAGHLSHPCESNDCQQDIGDFYYREMVKMVELIKNRPPEARNASAIKLCEDSLLHYEQRMAEK